MSKAKADEAPAAGSPQFTPGPWTVRVWSRSDVDILATGARVAGVSAWADAAHTMADARLIAAAPDLYTTLRALAHMARLIERSANLLPGRIGYITPEAVYRPAEEAIAKAEGRSAAEPPSKDFKDPA